MRGLLKERPWIAVILVVAALGFALFSGWQTFGPTKMLPMDQQVAQEKETHEKLQKELQERFGIKPVPYGMPGAKQAAKGQVPTEPAAQSAQGP